MRTAISTIQCDASVNKLAISDESHHTMAIPFDNRHVRLYDLQVRYCSILNQLKKNIFINSAFYRSFYKILLFIK